LHWKDYSHEHAEFLYHSPGNWEREQSVWAVRGGQSVTKPGYMAGPKRMDCYSLHLIKEGHLLLMEGDREIALRGGDLFCMYKGRSYTYSRDALCKKMTLSWLAFDGPGVDNLLDSIGFTSNEPYLRSRINSALLDALTELFQLIKTPSGNDDLFYALEVQGSLLKFFARLGQAAPMMRPASPAMEWVRQSIRYIELHAAEGLSVEQLAALAGMNRNYFSTAFAEQVGMSPLQYITQVRMDKAAELLDSTSASIAEIAYSIGYINPFSFTRAFAKYAGMPPSAYRSRLPNENKS
jgi:AraC-like DNA-binding protein